jgi:hypothetical protein
VPFLDDLVEEPEEAVTLSLSNAGGCAALGASTTATLAIWDDDGPPPDDDHTIGGTASGLEGSGLVLTNLSRRTSPYDSPANSVARASSSPRRIRSSSSIVP